MTTDLFNLQPESTAVLSDCGTWRYRLDRSWTKGPKVAFIMLNPSAADAEFDDPTIRRCRAFARDWGYGGLIVGNLFALRSTDPAVLARHPDPIGPDNDRHLVEITCEAEEIVCAWGIQGALANRDRAVTSLLNQFAYLKILRLTTAGFPGHPLYLPGCTRPKPWEGVAHG